MLAEPAERPHLFLGSTNSLGLLFQIFSISYFCQEISGQSWPWSYDMTLHIEIGVILLKYFFVMIFSYVPSDIIYNSLTLCIPSEVTWLEFDLSHLVSNEHSLPLENILFLILTR